MGCCSDLRTPVQRNLEDTVAVGKADGTGRHCAGHTRGQGWNCGGQQQEWQEGLGGLRSLSYWRFGKGRERWLYDIVSVINTTELYFLYMRSDTMLSFMYQFYHNLIVLMSKTHFDIIWLFYKDVFVRLLCVHVHKHLWKPEGNIRSSGVYRRLGDMGACHQTPVEQAFWTSEPFLQPTHLIFNSCFCCLGRARKDVHKQSAQATTEPESGGT